MQPIWRFQFLHVAACFPSDDRAWKACEPHVPERGRQGLSLGQTPHDLSDRTDRRINACQEGVVYLCLLHHPLFRGLPPGVIRDVRTFPVPPPEYPYRCQDWRLLLDTLVDMLLWYETDMVTMFANKRQVIDGYAASIRALEPMLRDEAHDFQEADGRWDDGIPPRLRVSRRRRNALLKELWTVWHGLDAGWTMPAGWHPQTPAVLHPRLVQWCDRLLRSYGPDNTPGQIYTHEARYAATFALLQDFRLIPPTLKRPGTTWIRRHLEKTS